MEHIQKGQNFQYCNKITQKDEGRIFWLALPTGQLLFISVINNIVAEICGLNGCTF